ncbi:hypothetical protein FOH24_07210 [Acetobacter tropicalis]|nr:hypothetical protein [Acetobacter tropicalis]KAA8387076.1 hypothetical protein FOH22_10555 [Acetobacter tropicalis]KAA8391421.1 hypothetical protein FOH24_07210 [Acetobacter tropicalis]MDO8171927.1 hypothetical protein [Acetobacter tropicalis]
MSEELHERAFWAHLDACAQAVRSKMRPDAKVTIIVRAPEALPSEALISSNDDLSIVCDAVQYFEKEQNTRAGEKA